MQPIDEVVRSRKVAGIAQLVEHNLAKVGVASSSLVSRSKSQNLGSTPGFFVKAYGAVAEWLCSGLQLRVRRFDSDPRLQLSRPEALCELPNRREVSGNARPTARVAKLVDARDLKSLGG